MTPNPKNPMSKGPVINRRSFLAGSAALAMVPAHARAEVAPRLVARPGMARLLPDDYPETPVWGYEGGVPGPELRLKQGGRLVRQLVNELPQATSVHWHGVRVPNAMDGVPGMTQQAVAPGDTFTYDFTPPDAGTFWYHSHNQSTEQIARGLYGVLIVDEADPLDVDHDISVVLDDWRLSETGAITDDFDRMHDWTHAGRIGNFPTAALSPQLSQLRQHDRLRLRLVNTAVDRIMVVGLHGMTGAIVALDGMPLKTPEQTDHVILGPAQRADFITDVTAEVGEQVILALHEGEDATVLSHFDVVAGGASVARGAIDPLPANPLAPLTSAEGAKQARLIMEGGAMGRLRQGIWKGDVLSIRDLVAEGQVWTFNGVAGLPEVPLIEVSAGEIVEIPMQNDTAFPHAMHLHGHHFQERLADGTFGPLRDTLLLGRGETRSIVFRADNPGDWLLHCHMLSHQKAGMKTWIRVVS
ncbi:multicopper oxidase family protein [Aliiroseovarius crassostreae]|uniref:multicopper oxidase family protein n=2 Tax=Aliiroseovarius crassostreae TaxID=154981 RepID=UPI00223BE3B3|nr:multicopper oxidase family protein [Aliiroseovarius crassostreae]